MGKDFNADEFAQTFKDANVDSVTVFAMCHHGHLYYDTKHPARHPGLPIDLNLLELQVEALHNVGIRAPIYFSVQCNEYAANAHPDWIALTEDLKQKPLCTRSCSSNSKECWIFYRICGGKSCSCRRRWL